MRRSSGYEQTGARVLPATIARTARGDGPMGALTATAPRAMPGQAIGPSASRQARAIPVGGHSGVT